MSRRVVVGFVILNVMVSLAVALLVISVDRARRPDPEPVEGPTQIVILTATPLPGLDLQPAEYQTTIDALQLTGTALYNNAQVVAVITATPDPAEGGVAVPQQTPLATIDPALLPPVPTDLPTARPSATPFDDGCLRHTVQAGEVPIAIAQQYGVFPGDLLDVNGLDPQNPLIRVGEELIIPVEGCQLLYTPTPPPVPTNTPFELTRVVPTVTPPPTAVNAQIVITNVLAYGDINNEAVELRNEGDVINLQGWTLATTGGESFRFPEMRMQPGSLLRIFSRGGQNTPAALYWGRETPAWTEGDLVTLSDAAGEVQATFRVGGGAVDGAVDGGVDSGADEAPDDALESGAE